MNSSCELGALRLTACHRLQRLRKITMQLAPPVSAELDRSAAFVVIETLNLWAGFSRSFYLSCAFRGRSSTFGRVSMTVTPFSSPADALRFAIRLLRPTRFASGLTSRRDEPTWHEPATLVKLFIALGASNSTHVQRALSLQTSVFKLLPVVRNFFAHRNEDTARKADGVGRDLSLPRNLRPSEMMSWRLPGRPQSVLADWIDDIQTIVELMCE
jgi:hypothetical protein